MEPTWVLLIFSPASLISHEARNLSTSQPLLQLMINKEILKSTGSDNWKSVISLYLEVLNIVFTKLSATQTRYVGTTQG